MSHQRSVIIQVMRGHVASVSLPDNTVVEVVDFETSGTPCLCPRFRAPHGHMSYRRPALGVPSQDAETLMAWGHA